MKNLLPILIMLLAIGSCVQTTQTGWTKWRGPLANGTISEDGWSASKLDSVNILWRKDIGFGHSAATLVDNRCFISGWKEVINNTDTLANSTIYCFEVGSGDVIWEYTYPSAKRSYPGPRSSPVVDGNRLYSIGWAGTMYCLDAKNGDEIWTVDLAADSLTCPDQWGYNPSPVVYNQLILLNLNKGGIAINKKNGEVVWNSEYGSSHFSSVQLINYNGKKAGVFMADSLLNIIDPLTGECLSSYTKSSEMGMENDVIQLASGNLFTSNELLALNEKGLSQVWLNDSVSSAFRTGVVIGDYAYQFSNYKRKFYLYCVDLKTGQPAWFEDLGQWGALSAVNNKLMIVTGLGKVIIAEATPEKYLPIAELQVLSAQNKPENWCWTAPSFFNGQLYIRNSKGEMACINLKE